MEAHRRGSEELLNSRGGALGEIPGVLVRNWGWGGAPGGRGSVLGEGVQLQEGRQMWCPPLARPAFPCLPQG